MGIESRKIIFIIALFFTTSVQAKPDLEAVEHDYLPYIYDGLMRAFTKADFYLLKDSSQRNKSSYLENPKELEYPEIPFKKIYISNIHQETQTVVMTIQDYIGKTNYIFGIHELVWIDIENDDSKRLRLRLVIDEDLTAAYNSDPDYEVHDLLLIDLIYNTAGEQGHIQVTNTRERRHKRIPALNSSLSFSQSYYPNINNLSFLHENKRNQKLRKPFRAECGNVLEFASR